MSYTADHARAYADIRAAGAAVTFTRTTTTTDDATGLVTVSSSSVAGVAMRIPGDANRYARLNLVPSLSPTLMFAATTYGDAVAPGDTCTWGGTVYTVRDAEPLDLDAEGAIFSTLVLSGS